MKRGKIILLAIIVLVFAFSSVFSFRRHVQVTEILSVSLKTTSWAASELEREFLRYMHALRLTGLDDLSSEQLQLHFELLWSRVDVLLHGEKYNFKQIPGANELLVTLKTRLRELEPQIMSLQPGQYQAASQIAQQFELLLPKVREYNVKSSAGPRSRQGIQQAYDLHLGFTLSLLGLLFSGAALIFLIVRENIRSRHQAQHDGLTGLPNRKFFNQRLEQAAALARRQGTRIAIHIIDLNSFKEINDTQGHAVGDFLLQKTAKRLQRSVRTGDMVARLGGDEFAVIQINVDSPETCTLLARHMDERLRQEITFEGNRLYPSACIGTSILPDDGERPEQVLINADMAMYRAKKDKHGDSYRLFKPEMNAALQRRKALSDDLRTALLNNELELLYQPITHLESGTILSVEALLRWRHPQYGSISPLEVVSIAELYGLADQLNAWVLWQACSQNMHWREAGLPLIQVAVNISPAMYARYDLVELTTAILADTGLPANQLIIEVTEDATMQDIGAATQTLMALRRLGVELAMDDFGTGHSSLSHLKRLPLQKLKIDKSFVWDLNDKPNGPRFIRTIIQLAHSLELEVVAEGIETEENFRDLCNLACGQGQGYWLCRPVTASEIADRLREQANTQQTTCQRTGTA